MTTRVDVHTASHHVEVELTEHKGDDTTATKYLLEPGSGMHMFHIHSKHHITVKEVVPGEQV